MEANKVPADQLGAIAPGQVEMADEAAGGDGTLNQHFNGEGLTVKQTMRGCFQECCGCEAKSEYKIGAYDGDFEQGGGGEGSNDVMYAIEESNCCFRICCPSMRPLEWKVSMGSEAGGNNVTTYKKGWSFPLCFVLPLYIPGVIDLGTYDCPCCCLMPSVTAYDNTGKLLGEAKYICDMFMLVPKFGWFEFGSMMYFLAPETCLGGCCMVTKCGGNGGKAIYLPFHFRDPATKEPLGDGSGISKLWSGLKKECCSDADNFALKWPQSSTIDQRKGLLGLNFLVDLVWFESHK